MQVINSFKVSLLMFALAFWSVSFYAEELNLDELLLEMDSLGKEVDNMTLKDKSEATVDASKDNSKNKKLVDSKHKAVEAIPTIVEEVLEKPKVQKAGVEAKKDKLAKAKKQPNKKKEEQEEKPKDPDDGFGDFEVSKVDIAANSSQTQRRDIHGRDPFAPSVAMVSDYQKKLDDEKKKREEIRLARQKELDKKNEVAKKKKEAAEMLAKQIAAARAKVVQVRALALPKMKLKGFIRKPGQGVLALLDIKGLGTHIVRKGDIVSLGAQGTLKILEINNMSLIVKSGKVADRVVVR